LAPLEQAFVLVDVERGEPAAAASGWPEYV
jgi:hypothetical protein